MTELPNSPNKNPGIKREFYPLPVEDPAGWRCVEVHIPDGDEYLELLRTVLKSLTLWYSYTRDISHRGKVIADRFRYSLELPELGCDMNCEELTACLAPLFASLAQIDTNLSDLKTQVEASIAVNTAQPVSHQGDCTDTAAAYGGALSVVRQINRKLRALYAISEESTPDTLLEAFELIVFIFPGLSSLGGEVLAEIANSNFASQRVAYETAYDADNFEELAAFDLYCWIDRNGCELNNNIIGAWFAGLPALVPSNQAAVVYGRFAPVNITFVNQLAQALTNQQSLESYFQELILAYEAGTFEPVTLPVGLTCPEEATEPIIDLAPCGVSASSDGENIESLGGSRWRVTSTATVTDAGVAIKDINGAPFKVMNVTFPDLPFVQAQWFPTGGTCTNGFETPSNTSLLSMLWTWQAADVGARVEFDFLPA